MRQAGPGEKLASVLPFGLLEVDVARRIVRLGAQESLRLTPREWDLPATLARARERRLVTQRHLMTRICSAAHVRDTQYLRAYIVKLRQKQGMMPG